MKNFPEYMHEYAIDILRDINPIDVAEVRELYPLSWLVVKKAMPKLTDHDVALIVLATDSVCDYCHARQKGTCNCMRDD